MDDFFPPNSDPESIPIPSMENSTTERLTSSGGIIMYVVGRTQEFSQKGKKFNRILCGNLLLLQQHMSFPKFSFFFFTILTRCHYTPV